MLLNVTFIFDSDAFGDSKRTAILPSLVITVTVSESVDTFWWHCTAEKCNYGQTRQDRTNYVTTPFKRNTADSHDGNKKF